MQSPTLVSAFVHISNIMSSLEGRLGHPFKFNSRSLSFHRGTDALDGFVPPFVLLTPCIGSLLLAFGLLKELSRCPANVDWDRYQSGRASYDTITSTCGLELISFDIYSLLVLPMLTC